MANQVDIWKTYIEAEEVILASYSAPFSVIPSSLKHVKDKIFKVELNTASIQEKAAELIKNTFPAIADDNIDWENGIIKKYSNTSIDYNAQRKLFDEGPAYFLFANRLPAINFKLQSTITINDSFNEVIGFTPVINNDVVLLKYNDIVKIQQNKSSCIELIKPFGAIFNIRPDASFFLDTQTKFIEFLQIPEHLISFLPNGDIEVCNSNISSVYNLVNDSAHPYRAKHIEISIIIDKNEPFFAKPIHFWRRKLGIFWHDEKNIEDPTFILPRPKNKVFTFFVDTSVDDKSFNNYLEYLKKIFFEIFDEENVTIQYKTKFVFKPDFWWSKAASILSNKGFNVSSYSNTASFDFTDLDHLNKMRQELSSVNIIQSNDNGNDHFFKVHFTFCHPLEKIRTLLKSQIPHLSIHYSRDSSSLICSYEYHPGPEYEHEKLIAIQNIERVLRSSHFENCLVSPPIIALGYEEYSFDFHLNDGIKELEQQLSRLCHEEIGYKSDRSFESIGTLKKVDFPYIFIELNSNNDDFKILPTIYGDFKGEQDKLQRLKDTIDKIYSPSSKSCVNPKTKEIIKDSSIAEGTEDIERLQIYLDKLNEVKETRLNKSLNPKQLEAVTKSLFAKDVFVIQGPPGTGKSTGISEIIWQHLRENPKQKILVTSETNLAVDNALDKLRSPYHNLIKPVRFGNEENLDKEGLRFSYDNIENWVNEKSIFIEVNENEELLETDETAPCNILKDWIDRVAKYSGNFNTNEQNLPFISKWKEILLSPNYLIKSSFFDEFKKSINVVGATCSSIGKKSSTGLFTNFFKDYCKIYLPHSYSNFHNGINSNDKSSTASGLREMSKLDISFDLVIQDEASKATPPEMALPMVYANKSIVIGDHRQLPPMIDSDEFIQDILIVASKSKDKSVISKAKSLARQIKSNKDSFTVSHFERLYKNIHPSLKASFDIQYRMHPSINEVISQFYPIMPSQCEYGLSCGLNNDYVDLPDINNPESRYHGINISGFIQPNHHIVWIDTASPEIKLGTSRYNLGEINVVEKLLMLLNESETYHDYQRNWSRPEDKQIGLITFYGAQLFRLFNLRKKFPKLPMRISTVDRFQGMERNIIIVSTVRSNLIASSDDQMQEQCDPQDSLGFAEFPNRLNVALSRAKRLLIIVGNSSHFSKENIYLNVINTIKQSDCGLFLNANDFIQL